MVPVIITLTTDKTTVFTDTPTSILQHTVTQSHTPTGSNGVSYPPSHKLPTLAHTIPHVVLIAHILHRIASSHTSPVTGSYSLEPHTVVTASHNHTVIHYTPPNSHNSTISISTPPLTAPPSPRVPCLRFLSKLPKLQNPLQQGNSCRCRPEDPAGA